MIQTIWSRLFDPDNLIQTIWSRQFWISRSRWNDFTSFLFPLVMTKFRPEKVYKLLSMPLILLHFIFSYFSPIIDKNESEIGIACLLHRKCTEEIGLYFCGMCHKPALKRQKMLAQFIHFFKSQEHNSSAIFSAPWFLKIKVLIN